jgi:hypothetical protein
MLNDILGVWQGHDVAAKSELVRKLSSRPELMRLFSELREEDANEARILGRLEWPRENVENAHDAHVKRGRMKGMERESSIDTAVPASLAKMSLESSEECTSTVPVEILLNECLILGSRYLRTRWDEEAMRHFKNNFDEVQRRQEDPRADVISESSEDIYGGSSVTSEDIYGVIMNLETIASNDEAALRLHDELDQFIGQVRGDHEGAVVVDALWWEQMKIRLEAFEAKQHVAIPISKDMPKEQKSLQSDVCCLRDKLAKALKLPPLSPKEQDGLKVAGGVAVGVALAMGLAVGASLMANPSAEEVAKAEKNEKANKMRKDHKACANSQGKVQISQKALDPLPLRRAKGEPFEPFMNKDQEQRARMAALFESVDPSKLANLDKLVEKRKLGDFDQMWKLYKQKWGAKAVEEAFTKVRSEKNKFYRAKTVALLAANQPDKLPDVDHLMAKHEGKYDQMFKRWVETKKFDAKAVTAAHTTAMQQAGK